MAPNFGQRESDNEIKRETEGERGEEEGETRGAKMATTCSHQPQNHLQNNQGSSTKQDHKSQAAASAVPSAVPSQTSSGPKPAKSVRFSGETAKESSGPGKRLGQHQQPANGNVLLPGLNPDNVYVVSGPFQCFDPQQNTMTGMLMATPLPQGVTVVAVPRVGPPPHPHNGGPLFPAGQPHHLAAGFMPQQHRAPPQTVSNGRPNGVSVANTDGRLTAEQLAQQPDRRSDFVPAGAEAGCKQPAAAQPKVYLSAVNGGTEHHNIVNGHNHLPNGTHIQGGVEAKDLDKVLPPVGGFFSMNAAINNNNSNRPTMEGPLSTANGGANQAGPAAGACPPQMLYWDALHPTGITVPMRQPNPPVYYNLPPQQQQPQQFKPPLSPQLPQEGSVRDSSLSSSVCQSPTGEDVTMSERSSYSSSTSGDLSSEDMSCDRRSSSSQAIPFALINQMSSMSIGAGDNDVHCHPQASESANNNGGDKLLNEQMKEQRNLDNNGAVPSHQQECWNNKNNNTSNSHNNNINSPTQLDNHPASQHQPHEGQLGFYPVHMQQQQQQPQPTFCPAHPQPFMQQPGFCGYGGPHLRMAITPSAPPPHPHHHHHHHHHQHPQMMPYCGQGEFPAPPYSPMGGGSMTSSGTNSPSYLASPPVLHHNYPVFNGGMNGVPVHFAAVQYGPPHSAPVDGHQFQMVH